jgi:uncharacterized protein
MIKTIVSEGLPVDERLLIQKNCIQGSPSSKRLCIVTGTHGDELEGQFVCYEINRRLRENRNYLSGTIEIYPALNPLGIDSVSRGFPTFDLDINRIFPGDPDSHVAEQVAYDIIQDLKGADLVIDIHASNIFLREIPQARISRQSTELLLPHALHLNLDFIWIHDASTVLKSTLAHSLNTLDTPTIVVEMGVGMRINTEYGNQLTDGIFHLMHSLGMWSGPINEHIKTPEISTTGEVCFINAEASGILIPAITHSDFVKRGDLLCQIVNPLDGSILQNIVSPVDGHVFTLRSYPVVYEGSLISRIFTSTTETTL